MAPVRSLLELLAAHAASWKRSSGFNKHDSLSELLFARRIILTSILSVGGKLRRSISQSTNLSNSPTLIFLFGGRLRRHRASVHSPQHCQ
jgi:hypothetical protein